MTIVVILMLLAPGLISVRILWRNKTIIREDFKFIVSDYVIYSFLTMLATYCFMFITYPDRTVSFAVDTWAISHILTVSFVFKYSFVALVASLVLPAFIPWAIKIWANLEDKRGKAKRNTKKK